ncbi:MAG TPA: SIS domain-containing protein [Novosphingobium sp.]|nr:SIS domain-containing protein [Novosphingobium sp.]
MNAEQTLTFSEAAEAPSVAERQLAELDAPLRMLGQRLRELDPPFVLTCARGSSDHAATFAKYLIEIRARTPVGSYAPSASSLYATPWRKLRGVLFLAISQSGHSPDIVISAGAARDAGALVVALVNDPDSPLAQAAEITIPMLAGPEKSVAATKSFIASLFAIQKLAAEWTQDGDLLRALAGVPQVLRRAWELDWSPAVESLASAGGLFVLGRGLSLAIAQEAALKLKEICGLHAEAFSAAEVRHGPMALVGAGFPVIMLVPEGEAGDAFGQLAEDMIRRDAKVIMTGDARSGALALPALPGLNPVAAPLAMIQSFYRLAIELSLARGRDPDHPPYIRKVTETR